MRQASDAPLNEDQFDTGRTRSLAQQATDRGFDTTRIKNFVRPELLIELQNMQKEIDQVKQHDIVPEE